VTDTDLPWRIAGRLIKFITIYDSSGISATSEYYLNYVYVSALIQISEPTTRTPISYPMLSFK